MPKPIILSVDDDPEVLGSIVRDLQQHYGKTYRIVKSNSPTRAVDTVRQLKQRGDYIAMFIVDQRMPEMSGTELLRETMKLYPDSRRVLLTAYADTEAAIESINDIGLDHYLVKPWDPPDQRLYPVLDDLLEIWSQDVRLPYDGIRVIGARWSAQSYAIKEFLSGNQVPYLWIDIDHDAPMRELIESRGDNFKCLPLVQFPDGSHLDAPTIAQLAEKVGLKTKANLPFYDLVIVGGGPAGLANAVYGASEGLKVLLIEQSAPGGQAGTSSRIENYLGFPSGISGADLAKRATAQARRFGAEMLTTQEVVGIDREDPYRIVKLGDGGRISCYAILLATGMSVRTLDVPGIEPLLGIGAYYGAALSEAATYRDQHVCVVGGANSAGQGAIFIARFAKKVTMLVRAPSLGTGMSQYLVTRINDTENIEVHTRTEITAVEGSGGLERIFTRNMDTGEEGEVDAVAMFIYIGSAPRSEMLEGFVERDEKGFIFTGPDLPRSARGIRGWTLDRDPFLFETNIPGIFVAGDVRAGSNRRVAAAVGEGSAAIYNIHKYLETV